MHSSPRKQTHGLRERAWWVIRRRGSFTLVELLATVADGAQKDAANNLGKYIRALNKAGILTVDAKRVPGTALTSSGCYRYRLAIDLGHEAPVWRATSNTVYDPNKGVVYPILRQAQDEREEVSHA
jgi:hypothetical protein